MSENLEQKNKEWVRILLDSGQMFNTLLTEDELVGVISILQSGKEGLISVMSNDTRLFLKAGRIAGIQVEKGE